MWYVINYLRRKRLREAKRRADYLRFNRANTSGTPPTAHPIATTRILGMSTLLWTRCVPFIACAALVATWLPLPQWVLIGMALTALAAAVLVAVHHAEVVAHRVGEPFGTLILALAVTIIEVALIVSIMLSAGPDTQSLARDTVFATVMIICNGAVGLCLLIGTMRHFVLEFRVEGASPALSVLIALTTLTLILPTLTTTTPGPTFSPSQLVFAGAMSLILYGVFVFVQTVRHRDYFLPVDVQGEHQHAAPPSTRLAMISLFLLCLSLIAVVGLAKSIAPFIKDSLNAISAPPSVVGIAIALLVLMPETWAAIRAALRNRMQTSLNLLLGSALATIGLTIPSVAVISLMFEIPLHLGLPPKETALLVLTFMVSTTTLAGGQATVLHGVVHLVLFATFLFLAVVP
jgi:Ca2+:H+ antiporter